MTYPFEHLLAWSWQPRTVPFMSRHALTFVETSEYDDYSVIGWDPDIESYFVQMSRNDVGEDPESGAPTALWLGYSMRQFPELEPLLEVLRPHGTLPADLVAILRSDKAASNPSPSKIIYVDAADLNSMSDETATYLRALGLNE